MIRDKYGRYILYANHNHKVVKQYGNYRKWVGTLIRRRFDGALPNWTARGEDRAIAFVTAAQWAADCPYCGGSQIITRSDPFFCVDCLMAGNDGYAIDILWPDSTEQIERVLLARNAPETMNYLPHKGDTLDGLVIENIEHGFPPLLEE